MSNRTNAIYARISVDRDDTISTETQIECCEHELKGDNYKAYIDKGYSGKNVDRPQFQQLMEDIRQGLIAKVVVYRLDRISRSVLDFATMMNIFDKHKVEFISSTETFHTSTVMGRAMLNVCIVFAQLERETIQKRVTDAYDSRSKRGIYMGGKVQYGYTLEPTEIDGIKTKKLVQIPEQAKIVELLYEMYAQPQTTVSDLIRYLNNNNIILYDNSKADTDSKDKNSISTLTKMLRSPVYAKADIDIYNFFKNNGAVLCNDPSEFTGEHGCYWYKGKDVRENKLVDVRGHDIVIAPHEAIVPGELWVKCRYKLMNNKAYNDNKKAKNTWLAGKMKCGHCGHALRCNRDNNKTRNFWISCGRRAMSKDCVGIHIIRATELEAYIFESIKEKMKNLKPTNYRKDTEDPKIAAIRVELAQVEHKVKNIFERMIGAAPILMSYANKRVAELDMQKQKLNEEIAKISANSIAPEQINSISDFLEKWDEVSFEDKRTILDVLITQFTVIDGRIDIDWKFD